MMTQSKPFYKWTRDLHLYCGLFASPFVLLFAISAIQLNHTLVPWGGSDAPAEPTRTVRVTVTDGDDGLAVAKQVRQQIGVAGEIGYVSRTTGGTRLSFPIESPGRVSRVRVDLQTGLATVERKNTGAWDGAISLHKLPGPHNVNIRGNWVFTRLWGWLADATVYLVLALTASGVYLWTVSKTERRSGLIFLTAGALSFVAIVLAIVA